MTKYIYKIALLAFASVAFVSCDEDVVNFGGTNFVTFENAARAGVSFRENSGTGEIPVKLAFALDHDLTVNFAVETETAVEGTDYHVLTPNSITIPAGELESVIRFEFVDNDILDDSKAFQVTLTSTSDNGVNAGLADAGSKSKRVLIINDDCTTNFDIWAGDVNITINGTVYAGFADYSADGACNTLTFDGTLHSWVGTPPAAGPITFTFTPNSAGATSGTLLAVQQLYEEGGYTQDGVDYNILYSATGTYNETTQVMTVTSSVLIDGVGSPADVTATITPAP